MAVDGVEIAVVGVGKGVEHRREIGIGDGDAAQKQVATGIEETAVVGGQRRHRGRGALEAIKRAAVGNRNPPNCFCKVRKNRLNSVGIPTLQGGEDVNILVF